MIDLTEAWISINWRIQFKRSCERCLKKRSLESEIGYLDCEIMNNLKKIKSEPVEIISGLHREAQKSGAGN